MDNFPTRNQPRRNLIVDALCQIMAPKSARRRGPRQDRRALATKFTLSYRRSAIDAISPRAATQVGYKAVDVAEHEIPVLDRQAIEHGP